MSISPRIFNPSPRTIYLVRHGETEGNLVDKAQGQFDAALTERGKIQAEAVAKRLSDIEFDAIYSSDLRRAFETAKKIAAYRPGIQIYSCPQLREYDFGDYEDALWTSIADADPELFQTWKNLDTRERTEFPGGESMQGAWNRIGEATREILANHQQGSKKILIVGHGGSLQGVMGHLLVLRIRDQWRFAFNNTSVTVLREHVYTPNAWRTYAFNDTSHLNGIGLIDRSKR